MNALIRQVHRWTCIAFTVSVAAYIAAMTRGPVPGWLNVFPAGSLILLLATGLYMFALPHLPRRGARA